MHYNGQWLIQHDYVPQQSLPDVPQAHSEKAHTGINWPKGNVNYVLKQEPWILSENDRKLNQTKTPPSPASASLGNNNWHK